MRLLINAISVKTGGPLVVLKFLTKGMARLRPFWDFHIITDTSVSDDCSKLGANVTIHSDSNAEKSGWRTRLWYETGLPKLVQKLEADFVFSHTNYLPIRRLKVPTILLEQHAGHFSKSFNQLMSREQGLAGRMAWKIKGCWVRGSIKRADTVTVQTAALAEKIVRTTGIPREKIIVIPHGSGLVHRRTVLASPPLEGQPLRVGYITNSGVQKNFDVLLDAARRLQDRSFQFKLVLTLDSSGIQNQRTFDKINELGIRRDVLENHGKLSQEGVRKVYESLNILVFPSLCESFGFPMVEALSQGIPLITSDVDCNREIGGTGAITFPPHDGEALSRLIERFQDQEFFRKRALMSLERSKVFDWNLAAARTIRLFESQLSLKR